MKKIWGTFALILVLASTLFSYELNAAGTSTTSNCTGATGQNQLSQYCGSSQSAQQGSDSNSALWKVWGGVSVVCIHACLAGGGGVAGTEACNIDSKAGATTEGVVTKNYSAGLVAIAQTQGTSAVSSKLSGNKPDPSNSDTPSEGTPSQEDQDKAKAKKAKASACSGAAVAAGKAMSNFKSSQSAAAAAETTKKAAASLDSNAQEAGGGATTAASLASSHGSGIEGSGKEGASAATAASTASVCASARQTSSTIETLQCAVASEPGLPAIVTSGQLPKAFTKASGTDFSSFGNNPSQSPADAIAQAASGSLSTSDSLKVAALLKGMEADQMAAAMAIGAMYASAGGTGPSGSDEPQNAAAQAELQEQMKDQMNAMMAKMQAGQAQDKADSGISAVIYANQNRSPAAIPQDKTLSIFDRVTYRYYFVVKQLRVENAP